MSISDKKPAGKSSVSSPDALRQRAEELVQASDFPLSVDAEPALHELRVHQIELEMQNDELRRVQVELETSRTRYFELYDLAPVGYCTLNGEGVVLQVNLAASRLLGLIRKKLVGQKFPNFIDERDQDSHYLHRKRLDKTGEIQTYELRLLKSDASQLWVQVVSSVFRNIAEETEYHYILNDITQRKHAEELLNESLDRYRSVTQSATDAIITANSSGEIVGWNASSERLFGYSESEMVGQSLTRIMPQRFQQQHLDGVQGVLQDKSLTYSGRSLEVIGQRKNGSEFSLDLSLSMWSSSTEKFFTAIMRDITDRKNIEETLRRTQKMQAIGQLTGGIAHDFNNILGVIMGNAELLEHYVGSDSKSSKYISAINRSSQRAVDLTRQLLNFSRLESIRKIDVDINQVISEWDELIKRSVTPEIEVQYQLAKELWKTEIDPGDFRDALLNLIINARDAMDGHGKLFIETRNVMLDEEYCRNHREVIEGQYIELDVNDSGTGISQEQLEHIYEPFYTTKEVGKGTGLGLSLVFSFAQRSGGSIACSSEMGKSTTFRLYLPRKLPHDQVAEQGVTLAKKEDLPHGDETLLVVDDEPLLLEIAQELLEMQGYRVVIASNGKQALELLASEPDIALLFSDIVMPGGINGYRLAEQANEIRPDIKLLFASGYTKQKAVRTGDHFAVEDIAMLHKPYTKAELIRQIRTTLDE